jgi:hypothetical protein
MGKFEKSAIVAVCGVLEEIVMAEREKQHSIWRRERKLGEKKKRVGPVTVINWDPQELSPDLNLDWIQKQGKGKTQIWHGTHIKFKLKFQSSLKNYISNNIFLSGTQ